MGRPRLFLLMLLSFAAVIVLGVGGMFSVFWIAVRQTDGMSGMMRSYHAVGELERFYRERGSWRGIEGELADMVGRDGFRDDLVVLIDREGLVIAGNREALAPGSPFTPSELGEFGVRPPLPPAPPFGPGERDEAAQWAGQFAAERQISYEALPIEVRGETVGSLIYGSNLQVLREGRGRVVEGVLSAGLALGAVLLGVAAFVSGRISAPLRHLTAAANAVSAGQLETRVAAARVRELDELASAFNRMAGALADADRQRRQLTADVAHELRTPLSIIKGRLEGVQDGIYQPDERQVAGLLDEVAMLERLIDDLRLLALADAGQLPFYPESVAPEHLLRAAIHSFSAEAEQRGVALSLQIAGELPEIWGDPQRLGQVIANLISNALRHTPSGGQIRVEGAASETAVELAISDTGSGIAPEDLPHIFERFYRADRSRSRRGGGAGLGLAIARRIVEAHGGSMAAHSTLGQGTTIRISLPLAAAG